MAVIELGLVHSDGDEPPAEVPRRPLGRSDLRKVLVALVAVCCVLTVTGSVRPHPRGLPQLWTIRFDPSAGMFTLTADSVYVLDQQADDQLTAYELRTGVVRWSRPAPADATWVSDVRAGVMLLPAALSTAEYVESDGTKIIRDFNRDTLAIDTRTGRQLWRQPGELVASGADRALLNVWNRTGKKVDAMRMVRLGDGSTIWTRPTRDGQQLFTGDTTTTTTDRLVTITPDGDAEVVSLDDGSVVTRARLPWRPQQSQESDFTSVTLEGRQLYLDRNRGEQSAITAYDTETLRPLWRAARSAPGGIYGCGPVVCVATTSRITGHDRRTGVVRWQITNAANGFPLVDGVLMVDDEDENGLRHRLVDAATGERITDLGSALPVWNYQQNRTPYLTAKTERPPGRMTISKLDAKTGTMLLRGSLPPLIDYGCQTDGALVACVTTDEQLIVTDVG